MFWKVEGKDLLLHLVDASGSLASRQSPIFQDCVSMADAILVLYDLTDRQWGFERKLPPLLSDVFALRSDNAFVALVGTKTDLHSDREISTEAGEQLAKKHDIASFEVSAKDGLNITQLFDTTVSSILASETANLPTL